MTSPIPGQPSDRGERRSSRSDAVSSTPTMEQIERIAVGLVGTRVRLRALLELLEEKGVLAPGEYDARAEAVWERDAGALTKEILVGSEPETAPSGSSEEQTRPSPAPATGMERVLMEAVSAQVRLRALRELLEVNGVLAPGEFDARVEAVWDRDYEELVKDFFKLDL